MAVLRVNVTASGDVLLADETCADWHASLRDALSGLGIGAPVTILIHGYRYSWCGPDWADAQNRLYRTDVLPPSRKRRPPRADWPRALGFGDAPSAAGLCIALGWEGRSCRAAGPLAFAQVYRTAAATGEALTRIVEAVASARPDCLIGCLTHSVGARVVLAALRRAPDLPIARAVLMAGAEFAGEARDVLSLQDAAGGRSEVFHMLARSNDLYDALFQVFAPRPTRADDRPLGVSGLGAKHPRWIDVQLDLPATRRWLARNGFPLHRAPERLSHWAFYADPGAMAFNGAILRGAGTLSIAALKTRGLPDEIEPRWSRVRAIPRAPERPEALATA